MGVPKRLTEMQMRFAHEIVTNEGRKNATECAVDAGYTKDTAVVKASQLQNPKLYPLVVKYIGELREEYQKKYAVTFERHISELGKIRMDALKKGAWSAAVNAEVARGKAAGLYVEQKIIRTGKLDDLSAEELEARMKEIIDQYSPILEGKVEVADVKQLQKDIRLNGSKSQSSKQSQKPLRKLNKLETSDKEVTSNSTSSSSSHKKEESSSDPQK
jgi:phage terminase small subunit